VPGPVVEDAKATNKYGPDWLFESSKDSANTAKKETMKININTMKPETVNQMLAITTLSGCTITFAAALNYKDELGSWLQLLMLLTQLISIAYIVRTRRMIAEPTELRKLNQEIEILKKRNEKEELEYKWYSRKVDVQQKINEGF